MMSVKRPRSSRNFPLFSSQLRAHCQRCSFSDHDSGIQTLLPFCLVGGRGELGVKHCVPQPLWKLNTSANWQLFCQNEQLLTPSCQFWEVFGLKCQVLWLLQSYKLTKVTMPWPWQTRWHCLEEPCSHRRVRSFGQEFRTNWLDYFWALEISPKSSSHCELTHCHMWMGDAYRFQATNPDLSSYSDENGFRGWNIYHSIVRSHDVKEYFAPSQHSRILPIPLNIVDAYRFSTHWTLCLFQNRQRIW